MKHYKTSLLGVAAIAVVLASAPALAGEERSDQGTAQSPAKKSVEKSREKRSTELVRCKTEASGMKGPERGNFMTECLANEGKSK